MTHGHNARQRRSPTYHTWNGMIQRCTNPNHRSWKDYGARGIKVCERWRTFANFLEDMGDRPVGLTLDRLDGALDYCKGNCCWRDLSSQNRNRRKWKWGKYEDPERKQWEEWFGEKMKDD